MDNDFYKVIVEAKENFIANGETYVCYNNEIGYHYCLAKSLREINVNDHNKGLRPTIMGYWSYGLTTLNGKGNVIRTGRRYYELEHYNNPVY